MQGYIKLHRQIIEWEWYSNINVSRLFIHCLLKANHAEKKWQGITINKGSFVTSYENLSIETGLSVQQVRTALSKLKLTGEITNKSTSHYSIISVKNWEKFQLDNTQVNKQITNNQQTNNKQITTNNNDKNDKNEKNIFSKPTKQEILDYVHSLCKKIEVDDFITYYEASDWNDKNGLPINWKQKALQWANRYKAPEEDIIERNTRIIRELEEKARKEGRI